MQPSPSTRHGRLERVALASTTALLSLNIWTGCPLLAVWIGSRFVPQTRLSMGAVFIVIAVLVGCVLASVAALARLNAAYDRIAGTAKVRRTAPWLRSMRAERDDLAAERRGISTIERILTASVVVAVLAFEVWFFFFASSSLPNA
jgi:hypothetical protein